MASSVIPLSTNYSLPLDLRWLDCFIPGGIKRERPSDEDYNSNNVKRAREDGPGPETTIRVLMQSKVLIQCCFTAWHGLK